MLVISLNIHVSVHSIPECLNDEKSKQCTLTWIGLNGLKNEMSTCQIMQFQKYLYLRPFYEFICIKNVIFFKTVFTRKRCIHNVVFCVLTG